MRNYTLLSVFIFIIFSLAITTTNDAFAGASGLCPIPQQYKVAMDGTEVENANPNCGAIGKSLHEDNMSGEPQNGTTNASFVVKENENHRWKFVAHPAGVTPSEINQGDPDDTTSDFTKWEPKLATYHPLNEDKSPLLDNEMFGKPCYSWLGIPQNKWDQVKWKVNTVSFVYHMDSPTKYGNCGHIGYHEGPGESSTDGGAPGKAEFQFAYRVPSVPIWYVVSSGINISWDWSGTQVQHAYTPQHVHCSHGQYAPCAATGGCCTGCQKPWIPGCQGEMAMQPCYSKPKTINETNWKPKKILSDIEEPQAAESRITNQLYCDKNGVPGTVYSVPSEQLKPGFENQPISVARATVRVKDTGNVAHVQIGTANKTNLLKSECGKKISEGEKGDEEIIIRIVDNAVHATKLTVVDNGEKQCSDGEWDESNFKVIFWYEMPLYQYASYIGDKWKDPGGVEKPLIEVAYSPMFVWKKHTICTKLSDFFKGANDTSKVYWYAPDCAEHVEYQVGGGKGADLGNPTHVIYEKKMKISELFISDDDANEDILPWHYATTSLGDGFGNPAYSKDVTNDLYGYCKDMNNADIIGKFKYKPMNYTKGKGPGKYFIEVHDGSAITKGGGRLKGGSDKFDCADTYFKNDKYENWQLRYNPDVVKYVQYPSVGENSSPGETIDPTNNPNQPCLSEDYEDAPVDKYDWKKNKVLTENINQGDGGEAGASVVENFQMWGRVETKDTIKPNVGLKIIDTVRGTVRKVYKINDLSTLACYKDLVSAEGKNWALVDNDKFNYKIRDSHKTPRAPFSLNDDNEKLWEFKDVQLLLNTSPNAGRIWEGKDFEGTFPDSMQDSMAPYGTAEDTKLEMTHQDMRNDTKKSNFVTWFAHDNIDGQRVKKDTAQIKKEDWYKGLTALDFDSDNERNPEFPDDFISKGYSSWLIKDETYADVAVFNQMYKNGSFFKYPDLSFNNPNRKWDGNALPNGDKEISVAYGVVDQAGNKRKFKLWLYVAPLDMKILTIEKNEKRTE
ncbi:MAG: hypothetical protein BWY32_01993 [bacterium ADurb.Bin243]|nr:MAG: hypothetical protein BWY32_01993 [bacterium ADurb.Bin243]